MTKLDDIPKASVDYVDSPEDEASGQVALARRLEAEGHRTIAVGRAILTIERCDAIEESPAECTGVDALKISIYSDPDVYPDENPVCLFIEGSKFGFRTAHLQVLAPDGRQRIFKLEQHLVRDEF